MRLKHLIEYIIGRKEKNAGTDDKEDDIKIIS